MLLALVLCGLLCCLGARAIVCPAKRTAVPSVRLLRPDGSSTRTEEAAARDYAAAGRAACEVITALIGYPAVLLYALDGGSRPLSPAPPSPPMKLASISPGPSSGSLKPFASQAELPEAAATPAGSAATTPRQPPSSPAPSGGDDAAHSHRGGDARRFVVRGAAGTPLCVLSVQLGSGGGSGGGGGSKGGSSRIGGGGGASGYKAMALRSAVVEGVVLATAAWLEEQPSARRDAGADLSPPRALWAAVMLRSQRVLCSAAAAEGGGAAALADLLEASPPPPPLVARAARATLHLLHLLPGAAVPTGTAAPCTAAAKAAAAVLAAAPAAAGAAAPIALDSWSACATLLRHPRLAELLAAAAAAAPDADADDAGRARASAAELAGLAPPEPLFAVGSSAACDCFVFASAWHALRRLAATEPDPPLVAAARRLQPVELQDARGTTS